MPVAGPFAFLRDRTPVPVVSRDPGRQRSRPAAVTRRIDQQAGVFASAISAAERSFGRLPDGEAWGIAELPAGR